MAQDVQTTVAALAPRLATAHVEPLQVRIGIGYGVATIGTFGAEYTDVGAPVNRAARLEPLAPAGGILVDDRTREPIDNTIALEPFDEVALEGFGTPQPAFRVAT